MKKRTKRWVIDLGTALTKITAGYRDEAGTVQLENYWIERTPQDVFREGKPEKSIDLVVFLRTLLQQHHRKDELILVLNDPGMVLSAFTFPVMTREDVREAVNWKMRVMIPDNFESWRIDFLAQERVRKYEYLGIADRKVEALGIAVQKQLLESYCRVFKGSRHGLKRIEPQFYGYGKLLQRVTGAKNLIIELGATNSRLLFYDGGLLQEEKRIETGLSAAVETYLAPVLTGIGESYQSPLGIARGYEHSQIYISGGESLNEGIIQTITTRLKKEIIPLSTLLKNQEMFQLPEELTRAERCLLMPCLSGMLE